MTAPSPTVTARVVHQVARPAGMPTAEQFTFIQTEVPHPADGQALLENLYLSVDPYMREAMDEGGRDLHTPLDGRAIGRVLESRDPSLKPGDLVTHRKGWRTHALISPQTEAFRVLPRHDGVPISAYLGLLGGTGLSAYVGLTRIARLQPGEDVFISAAAGGVGTAAGQIARLLSANRVIGSAGSPAKVKHLTEDLGFDAAFDYHDGRVDDLLRAAAPTGIDVYLDNVGGDHLEAAIGSLRDRGRIAWCGGIAQYNAAEPPAAPRNLYDIVYKQLRLEGFLVRDHLDLRDELEATLVPRIQRGELASHETVVEGFEHVIEAFLTMLRGGNRGKMLVHVTDG